jgi:hypothetical protein
MPGDSLGNESVGVDNAPTNDLLIDDRPALRRTSSRAGGVKCVTG